MYEGDAWCCSSFSASDQRHLLCIYLRVCIHFAADRVFELPPDHVNCTDSTGRNLLIFNSANYAKTKVAFQKAKDNCREYGAEILTRQQALLSCITNHRLGHEQYLHRDGEISTHNLSPVWVQDHRDYCTSLGVDGIPKTVSCEKPTHFLCAKRKTNLSILFNCLRVVSADTLLIDYKL